MTKKNLPDLLNFIISVDGPVKDDFLAILKPSGNRYSKEDITKNLDAAVAMLACLKHKHNKVFEACSEQFKQGFVALVNETVPNTATYSRESAGTIRDSNLYYKVAIANVCSEITAKIVYERFMKKNTIVPLTEPQKPVDGRRSKRKSPALV